MHAYFDSPETIRNKIKEFKTATIGGLNKQDVMNYLSILSEQQGVMIRLLRENNIPLFVDDGYEQEEQFMKPMGDGQDGLNLNQYLGFDNSSDIAELQAEIEALRAENESLKLQSYSNSPVENDTHSENTVSDFDVKYGIVGSSDDEKASLLQSIEEKDLYIKELENALQGNSASFDNIVGEDSSSNGLSDIERQAYEEEILNLRNTIESLESNKSETVDLFERDVVSLDEDLKESYEKEIEELRAKLEETLMEKEEALRRQEGVSSEENSLTDFDFGLSQDNSNVSLVGEVNLEDSAIENTVEDNKKDISKEEIEKLNSTIDSLNNTIDELKAELEVCHELLDEHANATPNTVVENKVEISGSTDSVVDSNQQEEIERLKTTIEILEIEVSKREKEKSNIEMKLSEANEKLARFTDYKDENGNTVTLDPDTLAEKHKELLNVENRVRLEKEELDSKLSILKEKEELIEANKHLVSEDFVNNITRKEQEIESLRKQMDKMLLVAQVTADETEKEASEKAAKLIEDAKSNAETIVSEAVSKKEELLNEATETLNSAKEYKATTEEELNNFREETRQNAENMIMEAQNKANEVLEEAKIEAQKSQEDALREVEDIMAKAEQRVSEIDILIQSKQKEIDNMQTYYLKVKNDGLVRVKQLYNQLENIIYSDEMS